LLPELVERKLRSDFDALRDTFRLYGVKPDIGSSTIQRMRAVKPMPPDVWAAAERRLSQLKGVEAEPPPVSPLVETVQGLLATMGYDCGWPDCQPPLACFRCKPQGGGLRSPLIVGCKDGPAEVADVQAVIAQFDAGCQQGYVVAEACAQSRHATIDAQASKLYNLYKKHSRR
jgi:hypothetical protein